MSEQWTGPFNKVEAELKWKPGTKWRCTETKPVDSTHQTQCPTFGGLNYWFLVDNYKTDGTPPDYYHCKIKGVDVECWDILDATRLKNHYYIASAFAYLWRCLEKENTLKDLVKARNFLNKEIADRRAKESNGTIQ